MKAWRAVVLLGLCLSFVNARPKSLDPTLRKISRKLYDGNDDDAFAMIDKLFEHAAPDNKILAANALFAQGVNCQREGRMLAAKHIFRKIARFIGPTNRAHVYANLGLVIRQSEGDLPSALLYFEKALDLNPNHTNALKMAAQIYQETKLFSSAMKLYDKALQFEADDANVIGNMCDIQRQLRNFSYAIELCEHALVLSPGMATAENTMSMVLLQEAKQLPPSSEGRLVFLQRARQFGGLALSHLPGLVSAWSNYALVLEEMGMMEEARKALLHARDLEPSKPTNWHNIGQRALLNGDMVEAGASYRKELELRLVQKESLQHCVDPVAKDKARWGIADYAWSNASDATVVFWKARDAQQHGIAEHSVDENNGFVRIQTNVFNFSKAKHYGVAKLRRASIQTQHGTIFRGCTVHLGGHRYMSGVRETGFPGIVSKITTISLEESPFATLVSFNMNNYFHFMVEALSRFVVFREYFASVSNGEMLSKQVKFIVPDIPFARASFALLEIPEKQLFWYDISKSNVRYVVEELYVADWFTSHEDSLDDPYLSPTHLFLPPPTVTRMVRNLLVLKAAIAFRHDKSTASVQQKKTIVYVGRAAPLTSRRVDNEPALVEALGEYSKRMNMIFRPVNGSGMSITEQIRVFRGADIILGPHGAGLTNALWAKAGAALVEFPVAKAKLPYFPFIAHVGKLLYWTVPVLSCQRNGDFYASAEAIEAVKLTLTYAHEAQMQASAEKTGHELEL
jgi:tetratricopeptide (TPR) repeat protein